jgi:hypothetical protein
MSGTPYAPSRTQTHWAQCFALAFTRPLPGWEADLRSCWDEIEDDNLNMSVSMYADRTLESRPPEQYDDISPCQRSYDFDGSPLWHLFIHNTSHVEGWDQI